MSKILDTYFSRPLFWDYLMSGVLGGFAYVLKLYGYLDMPSSDLINSTTSDVGNIAFTSAGFVLTFLTLLVSFKAGIVENDDTPEEKQTLFKLFLKTGYYDETIRHLKNAIKSLIFIAVLSYSLKLFIVGCYGDYKHWFNIFGVFVIGGTLLRCLLVLTKILTLQKNE